MSYRKVRTLDIDELNERLKELTELEDSLENAETSDEQERIKEDFGDAEAEELKNLRDLKDEIGELRGVIDDSQGPFVDESDFEEYARELADELGLLRNDNEWPYTCIDWAQAAEELRGDYTSVDWDGRTYYYRA